ncbi:DUF423 domain-containing protein [Bacillus horti]|uniref:DUF423 domain-containing protein n=1 Tax=Caldalkalibacillus horti TaxID=77523 RepID=UPI0027D8D266|nr:DUF423 domain-containing protein [Bacillus horti]
MKLFVILGSINALLAVAFGAFGSHGLKGKLSADMLSIYETGVQYHMYHAIGLVLIGILAQWAVPSTLHWAGWLMFFGIIFFSGSLYILSITGVKILGAITPIGGVLFLISWVLVAIAAIKA